MWKDNKTCTNENMQDDNNSENKTDFLQLSEQFKSHTNNNLYLYVQIILTIIFLTASVMLKFDGGNSFLIVKKSYNTISQSERVLENKFSYESFAKNFKQDLQQKYNALVQAISYTYGKGSNNLYPSDVSLKKYTLPQSGIRPIDGYITSPFGVRKDPFNGKKNDFHTGMDIASEKGTFIKAAFSGTVINAGYSNVAGNYIRIKTDDTLQSFYGHCQFLFMKEGDSVLQGQVIASVGQSGMATGPHLHFEITYNGYRVNPIYALE
ncbi:MAG: M23 family metallopeptidase [Oscillospiraceae bacterium]